MSRIHDLSNGKLIVEALDGSANRAEGVAIGEMARRLIVYEALVDAMFNNTVEPDVFNSGMIGVLVKMGKGR